MSEQVIDRQTPGEILVSKIQSEFVKAYLMETVDDANPHTSGDPNGSYYRYVTKPRYDKDFTRGSIMIVRKPPHPNDRPEDFTEIYAPLPADRSEIDPDTFPGATNEAYILHIRRASSGQREDKWIIADAAGVTELLDVDQDMTIERGGVGGDCDGAGEDFKKQRCAEKIVDLIRRENLIASTVEYS